MKSGCLLSISVGLKRWRVVAHVVVEVKEPRLLVIHASLEANEVVPEGFVDLRGVHVVCTAHVFPTPLS